MRKIVLHLMAIFGIIRMDITDDEKLSGIPQFTKPVKKEPEQPDKKKEPELPANPLDSPPENIDDVKISLKDLGEYKTPDEVKERLKKYTELEKEVEPLRKSSDELSKVKQEFDRLKDLLEDDEIYRLGSIKKQNPENYRHTVDLLYGKLNPVELLKMKFVKEHPEYKEKPEIVDKLVRDSIEKEYDIEDGNITISDPEDDKKKIAVERLKIDSEKARNELLKDFNAIEAPKKLTKEEAEKKTKDDASAKEMEDKEFAASWKSTYKKITSDFKSFEEKYKSDDGKEYTVKIELPEEEQKAISNEAANFIYNYRLPFNEEGINSVKEYMRIHVISRNLSKIIAVAHKNAAEEALKKVHNPSADKDSPGGKSGEKKNRQMETINKLLGS